MDKEPLDIVIHKTYAQTKACFIVIKNLQHEIQQLRSEQTKLRSVVLAILADPQARADAEMVVKEMLFRGEVRDKHPDKK